MPETVIYGSENAMQSNTFAQYRRTDKLPDEEEFKMVVSVAVRIMEQKLASLCPIDKAISRYLRCLLFNETELYDIAQDLIDKFEQKSAKVELHDRQSAYDALRAMASTLLSKHKKMPENLESFSADVLADRHLIDNTPIKNLSRPTKRGPNKDTNLSRDKALRHTFSEICSMGFKHFRFISKKNKGDFACSYKGGSCIDILGVAYEKISGIKLKYKTIEGIVLSG